MALAIEVVAIGNEILTGFTVNTNAAVIGQALLSIGLKVTAQRALPDDAQLLKAGLQHSLDNFDLIICTGGLGPTCDDQTRQIIAELFNCELKFEAKIAEYLQQRYHNRPVSINDQAMIPAKAEYVLNDLGTASALIFHQANKLIIFLPGVPTELEHFMLTKITPLLKNKYHKQMSEFHQQCNFMQLSESQVDPILRQLAVEYPQIEFGIYPNLGVITVHLISHFSSAQENLTYQQPIKEKLIAAFKENFFSDTTSKLEEVVSKICQERGLSLGLDQASGDLDLATKLSSVLVATVAASDIAIKITGIPPLLSASEVYSTDVTIELQAKNGNSSVKTFNIRGNRNMLIKRAQNLVFSELYKNLCYTS